VGENLGAFHDYRHATELDPRNADAYIGLGYSLHALGDDPSAVRTWRMIATLNGSTGEQILEAGQALADSQFPTDSIATINSGVARDAGFWELYRARADVEAATDDDRASLQDYATSYRLARTDADRAWVLEGRGSYYLVRGAYMAARSDFDRAIGFIPYNYHLFEDRAKALVGLSDFVGAEQDLTTAIILFNSLNPVPKAPPLLVDLLRERAELFLALGRKPEAVADLMQALQLVPAGFGSERSRLLQLLSGI